jgi:hypothetical protein
MTARVLVVGAGPPGLTAAILLAQLGVPVAGLRLVDGALGTCCATRPRHIPKSSCGAVRRSSTSRTCRGIAVRVVLAMYPDREVPTWLWLLPAGKTHRAKERTR